MAEAALTAPIDLKILGRFFDTNDQTRLFQVAWMFVASFNELLDDLRSAAARGDLKSVGAIAHGAKGAALNVGAHSLAAMLLAVEVDMNGANPALPTVEKLAEIEEEFARLVTWLNQRS